VTGLAAGEPAPDFTLRDQHGQQVTLSEVLADRAALIVFYPFAFTGVCSGELHALHDDRAEFDNDQVALLVVSTDSMYAQRIFAEREGFELRILSDFWPHGAVAAAYGVLDERSGAALRGTFLVGRDGRIRWSVVNAIPDARDPDDYRRAIAALAEGATPAAPTVG
jgi:peroxiredoxin